MSRLKGFIRDDYNNAVVNVDNEAYVAYMKGRESSIKALQFERETSKRVSNLTKDVSSLKRDIGDIKELLVQFLNKSNEQQNPKSTTSKKVRNGKSNI